MNKVIVIDKLPRFKGSLYNVMDDALNEGARDTLLKAKTKAPVEHGHLRGASEIKRVGRLKQRISFWIEYARFQEFGGDGKRRVRKYTTAGTGAHYLRNAGDEQARMMPNIIKKHAQRARA